MPDTNTICYYAMYVIGEVESQWNWQLVNYNDPITIGMMQWYGTRAAALLNRMQSERPTDFDMLAESLKNSLSSNDQDSRYWNSRYLNQTEGESVSNAFASTESHIIQEDQAIADFEGYISTLEGWGLSQNDPKPLIFAMCMYHQSPAEAGKVVATAGGSATLERIYQVCLNNGILGQYRTRYTTTYNRLKEWDGQSMPPDFGQNGGAGTGEGGENSGTQELANVISHITLYNNTLTVYGTDGLENGLVCIPVSPQTWKPTLNNTGEAITGGNTGGGSATGTEAQNQLVEFAKSCLGKFQYSQGAGRLSPETSGYTDCSGFCWYCYQKICGIEIGTWTGAQAEKGEQIAKGSGGNLPEDKMQPADLIIFGYGSNTTHVEMYIGNNQCIGHGSGQGPKLREDANAYCAGNYNWSSWQVRRYVNI